MKQKSYRLATLLLSCGVLVSVMTQTAHAELTSIPRKGFASWYGEADRGKLMANGKKFNPDRLTAASWFYPLGTRVRVTIRSPEFEPRSVLVTITDRGRRSKELPIRTLVWWRSWWSRCRKGIFRIPR
jgi:Lytic transglycolase